VNSNDFKELARIRLKEARVLLENGCYDGAYYLCGYAVECALKACIAKQTKRYDFPDKKTVVESYTHDLEKLVSMRLVGMATPLLDLEQETKTDPKFGVNWNIVKDWKEDSRYKKVAEKDARDLYSAIADRQHGVLRCIKKYW